MKLQSDIMVVMDTQIKKLKIQLNCKFSAKTYLINSGSIINFALDRLFLHFFIIE